MIANLNRFKLRRQPLWQEYDELLVRLESDVSLRLGIREIQRMRDLHETVAGDLTRVRTFAAEPETVEYLESLLARGFGFIHDNRRVRARLPGLRTVLPLFAVTVRKHRGSMALVLAAFFLGAVFGGALVASDPSNKEVVLPFEHLLGDPSDRVAMEEEGPGGVQDAHSTFAAFLMAHNIRVSVLVLVLGIFYGVLTLVVIFYNGIIVGAVVADYVMAGESVFLVAWLLPHGGVELPAFFFAAQAGLLIARAVITREGRLSLTSRLRNVQGDVVVLITGTAVLLVWAGIVESFFSQYHAPVLPYPVKILFGLVQFAGLLAYLLLARPPKPEEDP